MKKQELEQLKALHNAISTHVIIQAYIATDMDVNIIIYGFKMARLSNESVKEMSGDASLTSS